MRRLLIQPHARTDLLEIWEYLAARNLDAAVKVGESLHEAIVGLLALPGKGHFRSDVRNRSYRFWRVYSYLIAYRFDDSTLTVVRVVHGKRNVRQLFRKPE